jgi:hypothetical protein
MKPPTTTRNFWPYGIIATLVVFACGLAVIAVTAVRQNMDLVRNDYYEADLRYQTQIDRLNRTARLADETAIEFHAAERTIELRLPSGHGARQPSGRIQIYRPSDAALDRQVELATDTTGAQRIDAREMVSGLWKLKITWQVGGEEFFVDRVVVISPASS